MGNEKRWESGKATNGTNLVLSLELKDSAWGVTKKTGSRIMYLGNVGSSYGGDIIGQDEAGNDINLSASVYKKPHQAVVKSGRSNYKV